MKKKYYLENEIINWLNDKSITIQHLNGGGKTNVWGMVIKVKLYIDYLWPINAFKKWFKGKRNIFCYFRNKWQKEH